MLDIPFVKLLLENWAWRPTPVIPATWEAEIRKIVVQHQPGKKVSETPISTNKPAVVVHTCHPSYTGGIGMKIVACMGVRHDPISKLTKAKKGWGCISSGKAPA
jgi:hypothetical protein